jgi:hypothetical protein
MKDNSLKLTKLASAADMKGDYVTADAITDFLKISQALTLNKALQNSPGAQMSTQNLTDSAEGARRGYFPENPRGTFQDNSSAAPENPMVSQANDPRNWEGKTAEEIGQMMYEEANALRNDPSMAYRNNQSLMQYANFLRRYPNLPEPVRQQMYQTISSMILGPLWGQTPQMMQQSLARIYQSWPDIPADLKQYLNQEAQQIMQMQSANQQLMGNNANYMNGNGQSPYVDMPTTNLLGYQGAGMNPAPIR